MKSSLRHLIEQSDFLAGELYNQKRYQESLDQNQITLKLLDKEKNPAILKNIANLYYYLYKVDKSLEIFKEYLDISNSIDNADIRQFAQYLSRNNMFDEAYATVKSQTDWYGKHLDIGWFLHRENKFKEAFIETEIGRAGAAWINKKEPPNCQRWTGQILKNKKLCLIGEAGLGDEIIFCRWIKDLKELGAEVYYYTDNTLKNVIPRNFNIRVYDETIKYDYWVPSMSLPYLLGKEEAGNESYLKPNPLFVEKWKMKLNGLDNIISLNWTGEKSHAENQFRTIPIEYLVEKLKGKGTLVSVCVGAEHCPNDVIDLTKDITSWEDTFAILHLSKQCFTASSSVSVAAGSLGIETHLYDLVVGYFTWCGAENGKLSSWFPNVRVWRQTTFGEWPSVIDRSIAFLGHNS